MVSDDNQSITFLYKFGEGACPKSHGFNAARLADIPDEIIKVGSVKSVEFENFTKKIQLLKFINLNFDPFLYLFSIITIFLLFKENHVF